MNWFYEYKVKVWNDVSDKEEILYGVVYGEDFSEAVDKLNRYYGKDNIIALSLASTAEDECYEFEQNLKEEPSGFFKDIILLDKNLLK